METIMMQRSKKYAVEVFWLAQQLPHLKGMHAYGDQLTRSAFSQAANYRAARRAKSKKDFVYKLKIVLEEADESLFWLETLHDLNIDIDVKKTTALIREGNELTAIYAASLKTAKKNAGMSDEE